jgi:hypothetical protein
MQIETSGQVERIPRTGFNIEIFSILGLCF